MNAVTVRTERYALSLGFLDRFGHIVSNGRQFVYRPLVPTNDVMKVNDRRMLCAAVGALLFCFVVFPLLPFFAFGYFGFPYLIFSVL